MSSLKDLLMKFLKGIETGDAMAAAVVDEQTYIQHNPQTREGGEGIAALFARISKTDPKVRFIRVFEDGDFAFAHNEYDFANHLIAFEVFRFQNGRAVEHWDNIQVRSGPNGSGRGMSDGSTAIVDLDKTEENRSLARDFVETVLIKKQFDKLSDYVDAHLIQHAHDMSDGIVALKAAIVSGKHSAPVRRYDTLHRVLAEGNFVLCMCEGAKDQTHAGIYDLYRVDRGRIAEHWSTTEPIPPVDERKNDNGKF